MEAMERAEGRLSGLQEKALLLARGAPVRGREWMQAGMFLLSRLYGDLGREARYVAGQAGPHSRALDTCIENLVGVGLLEEGAGGIALTDAGSAAAGGLESAADRELAECVYFIKDLVNAMSGDELLCYMFAAHPDFAAESPRYEEITGRSEEILLGMVWGDKISIGRVAELIGKSIEYVRDKLRSQGYRIPL